MQNTPSNDELFRQLKNALGNLINDPNDADYRKDAIKVYNEATVAMGNESKLPQILEVWKNRRRRTW
jgi:hypothetical protein